MEMENTKKNQCLRALVNYVEDFRLESFDEEFIWNVVERTYPGTIKNENVFSREELLKCFGNNIIIGATKTEQGRIKHIYSFGKTKSDELICQIDNYTKTAASSSKDYGYLVKAREAAAKTLEKRAIENVYNYISQMPITASEYNRRTGKNAPSKEVVIKVCKNLCSVDVDLNVEKHGMSKLMTIISEFPADMILSEIKDTYKSKYNSSIPVFRKEEETVVEEVNIEEEHIKEVIPHKDFPDMFLSRIHKNIDDHDYNITLTILNIMMNSRKTGVIVTDVFVELKKNGIDSTGLNFSEWCRREHSHFRCCNNQIQLKPGDYCESVINKKPLLSKKEEKETIVVKNEVKKVNGETFYIISPKNLKETMNLSFNKEVGNNLKAYKMTVDFSDVSSILEAYNLIIKNTVLGDEVVAKITKFVKESIAERVEKIERKI